MVAERLLRDRPLAVSSGSSDLWLFGGTSGTFPAMSAPTAGATAGAAWFGADASAQHTTDGSEGSTPAHELGAVAQFDAGMRLGAPSGETFVDQTGTSQEFGASAARIGDIAEDPVFAAAEMTAIGGAQAQVTTTRPDGGSQSHAPAQQVAMTSGAVAQQEMTGGAELAQLGHTIQQQIAASAAAIDIARQDIANEIDALTDTIADEIASLQTGIGATAAGIAAQASALTDGATAVIDSLTAPVLGAVAALPDTIITTQLGIDLSADASLAGALGGQTLELGQSTEVALDAALDLTLPISGGDVAGGITMLVDMAGTQVGYAVGEVGSAALWVSTLPAPIDALAALDPFEDALAAPDLDPGAILLGIADTGSDLLGGLHLPDDHGIG